MNSFFRSAKMVILKGYSLSSMRFNKSWKAVRFNFSLSLSKLHSMVREDSSNFLDEQIMDYKQSYFLAERSWTVKLDPSSVVLYFYTLFPTFSLRVLMR